MISGLHRLLGGGAALVALGAGCRKAPLFDVGARFLLADASWFAEEETLFVFYELTAEQGLNDEGVVEITWTTDAARLDWTSLADLPLVHTHLPVDCGVDARCGSASFPVTSEPRNVQMRYRYHRDGALALGASTVFNVVGPGLPHSNRSLIAYGVMDEANEHVQWRGRHQFPTLRNEQVEELGLRRSIVVENQRFGTESLATGSNPYGYGVTCPADFVLTGAARLETIDRAAFSPEILPLGASDANTVCADVTVTDARGTFTTGAIARKNPEVEPAFPLLRSPIHDAVRLPFFIGPCDGSGDPAHEAMLRQRLQLGPIPTTCTDGWGQPDWVPELVVKLQDAIAAQRPSGEDMVLVIALSREEPGVADALEEALLQVVPQEVDRTTPRVAGAFVLDSDDRTIDSPELAAVTLWCPAVLYTSATDESLRSCAILPENLDLELGPFSFGSLPILPSRDQYLEFIEDYSVKQAGEITSLALRVPELAATTEHERVGDFGTATFLNNEIISADPNDAFSYCESETSALTVFRSEILELRSEQCLDYGLPEEYCAPVLSLALLPDWHLTFGERSYDIGIAWEFPFLVDMEYETFIAASVTAFGFSVPFGAGIPGETYYGSEVWVDEEHDLSTALLQCDRFCGNPTFDSAGVYHVTDPFRSTYANSCYSPDFPALGDDGYPIDP